MSADLVIKNVRIFSYDGDLIDADIGVKDGGIVFIGKSYPKLYGSEEVIDGRGMIALPSFIDLHVHIFSPGWIKETYATGTRAAALGGYSLVCDMASVGEWQTTTINVFKKKVEAVNNEAIVDVALYAGEIYSFEDLKEVPELFKEGALGLGEIMLCEPGPIGNDALLLKSLEIAAKHNKLLAAHCENKDIVDYYTQLLKAERGADLVTYSRARPPVAEAESIIRFALLARYSGSRAHVCHLTSRMGVEALKIAKKIHNSLTAEVTPHHLILDVENAGKMKSLATVTPPLRTKDDRLALWDALKAKLIDCISTDHAPYYREEKESTDIWSSPPGLPGLEYAFAVVSTYAVSKVGISLYDIQKFFSEYPARILGLYPKRGTISVGAEADIVLVEYREKTKIDDSWIASSTDYSPYEGYEVSFWVVKNFLRGQLIVDERAVTSCKVGKFLPL